MRPIDVEAEVVWHRTSGEPGIGVKFVDLSDENRAAIDAILDAVNRKVAEDRHSLL